MHRSLPTRWNCLACKHCNDADADACEQCGVPAGPSAEQVERAERVRATYRKWVIGQDWPAHIQYLNAATIICVFFVVQALGKLDFNPYLLTGALLAALFGAAGAVARRIERRKRILRLDAEEDEAEEFAAQRAAARKSPVAPRRAPSAPALPAGGKP